MNQRDADMQTYSHALDVLMRRTNRLKWARGASVVVTGLLLVGGEVRLAGLAALALGLATLFARERVSKGSVYVADKFILTDGNQGVRAILGVDKEYSTLRLFSPNGQTVLDLSASADDSHVILMPGTAETSAHLSSQVKYGPLLTLKGAFGNATMGVFHAPAVPEPLPRECTPGPYLSMRDAQEKDRVSISVVSGELGGTFLDVVDGSGKAAVSQAVDNGVAFLKVKNHDTCRNL